MPVDSMAMVFTPHCASQSARRCKSAVQAPKERTCACRLAGGSGGGGGASWGGTATQWICEWTSMPAAWRWVTRSAWLDGDERRLCCLCAVMAASTVRDGVGEREGRGREG